MGIESSGKAQAAVTADAINFLDDASRVASLPRFTMDDVSKHNTQKDCWVVVFGIVIDVTSFLKDHPGGIDVLAKKAGTDASKMFKMIHPERCQYRSFGRAIISRWQSRGRFALMLRP